MTDTTADETERAAFEAWAKDHGRLFLDTQPATVACFGVLYKNQWTQEAWVGWQARASLAAPTEPVAWPKLKEPALVGHTTFNTGVNSRLVVECAQRHYKWRQDGTIPAAPPAPAPQPEPVNARVLGERKRWEAACEKIATDLTYDVHVRLGAAKCLDAGRRAAEAAQPEPAAVTVADVPSIDDVLDALAVFNKPAPGDDSWTAADFIAVSALPEFIHNVGRAWYAPKAPLQVTVDGVPKSHPTPQPAPAGVVEALRVLLRTIPTDSDMAEGMTADQIKELCDAYDKARASIAAADDAQAAPVQAVPLTDGDKLWLWRDRGQLLAYRHEYPCYSPGGDPMTLGDPVFFAEFRSSHDRSAS